jgi:hypothetical protein
MLVMSLVRPTLVSNWTLLEDGFIYGYCNGVVVFNFSTSNKKGSFNMVTAKDLDGWGPL